MRVTINKLKEEYEKAIVKENYKLIDIYISPAFWGLKKSNDAYRRYIIERFRWDITLDEFDKMYDRSFGGSTMGNIEGEFMDNVLQGNIKV